ncbi:MAG TPA: RNA-binding S4 domain-containing protein, partial [Saprospiraceae bacterium]|nr:RNA-binding S4 domain-containing protein [Saprospiraceae bacterium]
DMVGVRKNGFDFRFKVLKLIDKRVGAALAIECYENVTPEEELNKYKDWFIGKAQAEVREKGAGRPTKRDRREIDTYKVELYDWEDDID